MLWDLCKSTFYQLLETKESRNKDISASIVVPKPCPSLRFKRHCNANKYLVTSICNSNTSEEVSWQTEQCRLLNTRLIFSLAKESFLLKTEFPSSTASGRGNILAWSDAAFETPKPHKFGPGLKRKRLSDWLLKLDRKHTNTVSIYGGVCLFVCFMICISVRKSLRHTCPVFHPNFCSFFCTFFDTGFKCFTFTNIYFSSLLVVH